MVTTMTRRVFLQKSGLVIAAASVSGGVELFNCSGMVQAEAIRFKPHAFLEVSADNLVTVWVGQTNLGQGTHTGIPMVIADELDADWAAVRVLPAPAAEPFKDPVWHAQVTGGSTSIRHRWDLLRTVGAAARQMLRQAAAQQWGIPDEHCRTRAGQVVHPDGRTLSFGSLAAAAARLKVPENPPLKAPEDYQIIGTQRDRMDIPDKVMGRTVFGMDFTLPDMCIAVVARAPAYGAMLESLDKKAAMAVKGVVAVIPLENRVAVCAQNTWAAIQGRDALGLKWSKGTLPDLDDAYLGRVYAEYLERDGAIAEDRGDARTALNQAKKTVEQSYKTHYISHAQAEPINCTAFVEKERCRIWAPTQCPTVFQMTGAGLTGLAPEQVAVNILPAGGGFGLRGEAAHVIDAVALSKALKCPVKVIYTRDDDFKHDFFRPANQSRIRAGLDSQGRLTAWSHKIAAQSVMTRLMPGYVQNGIDPDAVSGVRDMVYAIPHRQVGYVMVDLPVNVGFWRSVGYSTNTFVVESFMDEMAHVAGKDPVRFRLDHLEKGSRPYNILSMAADKGGWDSPMPAGRSRGIALAACFESFAAHMAEISVDKQGNIRVHKMVCAIDCGTAVYPDAIRAQAEAGVVMGLSVAFYEKVDFAAGGVKTSNYDTYPLLTLSEVPEIEVHIARNTLKAGGVGEPVFPSVAPAVANAVFSATGVRLRELPFNTGLLAKA